MMKTPLLKTIVLAAAVLVFANVSAAPQKWARTSEKDQSDALAFIQNLAHTRKAGVGIVAQELGINLPSQKRDSQGRIPSEVRRFGTVLATSRLQEPVDEESAVLVRFTHGCVTRAYADATIGQGQVISPPTPDHPDPAFGYAYLTGGSGVTLFFSASGEHCLTAARIEREETIRYLLERPHED